MVVTVVLVVAVCVLAAAALVYVVLDVVWWRRLMVRRRVMVNLRSGRAVTGTLWSRHGRTLVLKQAQVLEPGAEPAAADGDVVIDRSQVDFVQVAP